MICDKAVSHEAISRYFSNVGYPVTVCHVPASDIDLQNYGAIVHVARSNILLTERLGDRLNQIKDEEWVLMSGEDEGDLHCTVELTPNASGTLRAFIRTLWSMFNIA
tara:strand:+ start:27960 stop:28280 length:321 start_codon:yes stop_codon:yes gene_type:complete